MRMGDRRATTLVVSGTSLATGVNGIGALGTGQAGLSEGRRPASRSAFPRGRKDEKPCSRASGLNRARLLPW